MKRTILLLLTVLLVSMTSCRKSEQIKIVSGKVESLNMRGLRSADLILRVEVSNPTGKVVLEEVQGTLKHFGKVIGKVSLAPLELSPRTTDEYLVDARIALDRGLGLKELMSFMDIRRLKDLTVDISAKGKASGVRIRKKYRDIPLKKLLEDYINEKI